MEMASTLESCYTIADKYLLRFSSIDTVVVCRVCCACVCELFVYYFLKKIVMSVMYVKINVIVVRQEIEINSD